MSNCSASSALENNHSTVQSGRLTIAAENVTKRYGQRPVFKPVSIEASPGEIIAITGPNGAGKSTLLKILANVLTPTKGSCSWNIGDKKLDFDSIRTRMGFVAPYLELYDELSAVEHVLFVAGLKDITLSHDGALGLLDRFGLNEAVARSDRRLRAYSSGMKQRVRCAMAVVGDPAGLLLDEPTSNLDEVGTEAVLREARAAADRGAIVFLATNETREKQIASRELQIEIY